MAKAIGLPTRITNDIVSLLLSNQDVCKLLTCSLKTEGIDDVEDIKKPWELFNKNIFVGRRIPDLLLEEGSYITVRLHSWFEKSSSNKKVLDEGVISISVISSINLVDTVHGPRDVALSCIIKDLLGDNTFNTIGKLNVYQVIDIEKLPVNYPGYMLLCKFSGYSSVVV